MEQLAPIVQRIEQLPPKRQIQVQFPVGAQKEIMERRFRFHNDPEITKTEDMTPTQLVEAGEDNSTYISHDSDGIQVVVK